MALLLRPATQQLGRAGAGLAIGYATAVKLTNGVVGAVLAVLVAWRHGWRQALPYAAGALVSAADRDRLLAEGLRRHVRRRDLRDARIPGRSRTSATPGATRSSSRRCSSSLLAPLLVIGCFAMHDRWALAVVGTPIVVNAVVYSFYDVTALHPRFLYVALPFVFVLEAAARAGRRVARRRARGAAGTRSVSVDGHRRRCG